MPERDPHPSAGEHPRSLLRNQGCKTGRGLFCSPSEEAWGLPLWPGPSGHLLRGHFGQRAAGGQLSPWPTPLAARLCLPSAPSPTRSIPEERPMPGTPRGGTASSGPPPPLPGWRPEGMSISAWQGSRTALGISDQGAGLPPRSPDDSGQLLPPCECLAGLWVPGPPPPPRPAMSQSCALGHSRLSLQSLHTQSTAPAGHSEMAPEKRATRGPHQLRVEGPACYGVGAVGVEAFT